MSTLSNQGLDTCPGCGRPVRISITAAGKRQPLDPEPNDEGNTVAYLDHTGTWRSRRPTDELPQLDYERRFMPHVATCPNPRPRQLPIPARSPHGLPPAVAALRGIGDRRRIS